jgi:hypothetical protein
MVYSRLLKDDFEHLPATLRRFHAAEGTARARGVAHVRHTNRLLARLLRFPPAGENIAVELQVTADDSGETWIRKFGDRTVRSVQRCERGLLVETMGPIRIRFRAIAESDRLVLESVDVRFWSLPLPIHLRASERGNRSGWTFDVEVGHIARYGGTMELLP